jgi:hypothetical protein
MSDNATSNAEDVKPSVNSSVVTESEFLAARIAALTGKMEGKRPPVPEGETVEIEEAAEPEVKEDASSEQAEPEAKEKDATVLSQIDFDQLSEAEIMKLAEKARSKALSRFGELTADKKALQQQIANLQAQLSKTSNKSALETAPEIPPQIAALKSLDEVKAMSKQASEVVEWAETLLDQNEHLAYDDVVAEIDGKPMTKAQVKQHLKTARKTKDQFLPAQLESLQAATQRAALREAWNEKAKQELEWMSKEDDDVRKKYDALSTSELVAKIKKAVPEVEPDLDYILGHAINSIHGRKYHALTENKPSLKLTPPSAVKPSAGSRSEESLSKSINELQKKFETTGSYEDAQALRTAQLKLKRR